MNRQFQSSAFQRVAGLIVLIVVLLILFSPRLHIGVAALFDRSAELTQELEFKEPTHGLVSIELRATRANGGRIEVTSTDGNEIVIRATHRVRTTHEDKGKAYLGEFVTDLRSESGRLVVESKLPERKARFFNLSRSRPDYIRHESVSYQVWIPKGSNIRELRADTDDGDITLVRCSGGIQCPSDDSRITLEECSGRLQVDTDDGDIKIVRGLFDLVEFETDDGNFEFNAEGTGDTTIYGSSDSGRILIQSNAVGVADLSSDSGNITAAIGSVESKVTLRTDDGRIDLVLSKDQPFSLSARFEKGRMRNGFKLDSERRKEEQLTGTYLGGGPQIDLSSEDGTIRLGAAQETP